jgi:glutamate formiminotransferase / 5-formyltetrahydrofolate cyclo-ligase
MLECVVNLSEGRDSATLSRLSQCVRGSLLDVHSDTDHNRAVFTLAGKSVEEAARALARTAIELLDLRRHEGVHPRVGVVDVVPFAPIGPAEEQPEPDLSEALEARDQFASWAASELSLPCFLYGPERSLPEVRRRVLNGLRADFGPKEPHPTAGACCVGARPVLVAYNLILATADLQTAKRVARAVRSPDVRALGLPVAGGTQVSCNLIAPRRFGPADLYDRVAALAPVASAELVGLLPEYLLEAVPEGRWADLGLSADSTIEGRLWRLAGEP